MNLAILLISCIGLCQILMYGKILNKPRTLLIKLNFFKELLSCSLCVGFHSGWMLSIIHYLIFSNPIVIFIPFASAFACLTSEFLLDYFENYNSMIEKSLKEN